MPSKKKGPKLALDENVYDEIDSFHLQKDNEILFGARGNGGNKYIQKEVLSVRVDDDEDEYSEGDENQEVPSLSLNKWGKKRRDFYGTSYVDKDFGGVRDSEEEEMLDLEQEDAIVRQKKLDSANNYVDMADFGQVLEWESDSEDEENRRRIEGLKKLAKQKKKKEELAILDASKSESPAIEDQTSQLPAIGELHSQVAEQNNDEKRGISYEMQTNKGLTVKRKKGTQHSRIKKRQQYDKALIRRRSQVPDVRRELTKYDEFCRSFPLVFTAVFCLSLIFLPSFGGLLSCVLALRSFQPRIIVSISVEYIPTAKEIMSTVLHRCEKLKNDELSVVASTRLTVTEYAELLLSYLIQQKLIEAKFCYLRASALFQEEEILKKIWNIGSKLIKSDFGDALKACRNLNAKVEHIGAGKVEIYANLEKSFDCFWLKRIPILGPLSAAQGENTFNEGVCNLDGHYYAYLKYA
uniref:Sas10 C-terminal domain-containing protein n=1 Tax=Ditylenchus dipsaci TaxID=166011 RepID=A0A915CXD4_9BILA